MDRHGEILWNELLASDVEAAQRFYGGLLGWSFEPWPSRIGRYYLIRRAGERHPIGGLFEWPEGEPGGGWYVYLGVADIDARIATARALGGQASETRLIPGVGRVAHAADAEGRAFGLFEPVAGWGGDDYDPRAER
jgi:predicted enzyme related to lactoylglutathione lyase